MPLCVNGPRADESYTYDDNGNRTGGSYDTDPNNLTVSDGTYDYEYDDEGNRTKRTEIGSGDYEVYEWDHRNWLVSVTFYDMMDTELKSVDHAYDIFNRWLRRTTDPAGQVHRNLARLITGHPAHCRKCSFGRLSNRVQRRVRPR